ncbi:sensor domain-containing diguanylate cyclase [Castellaniella defragrans]|uniref:sensor domain-containing diguanylate cyclase n=1 Tax=Castellaniella defragrans TaxID=75697 RepID=UPI002AFFFE99|nr:sensor domain-containing diguanylate cyclase [Castellaniella defragrans]
MRIRRTSRINLRQLILLLAVFSAALMLVGGMVGAYQVQRQQLMASTLDANEAFAAKLARTTSDLLLRAQSNLSYAAMLMVRSGMTPAVQQAEVDRLRHLELGFNSVTVVDMQGVVQAAAPEALGLKGRQMDRAQWRDRLNERVPTISAPFVTVLGNLAIVIAQPLLDAEGRSLGRLSATMYLRADGGLQRMASEQYFRDGTYVYVVDAERRLLYHPEPARIGTVVAGNPVIEAVRKGRSGQMRLVNSQGVDMLAGYAHVAAADWGVVVQRPTDFALQGLSDLMLRVLRLAVWPALVLLAMLWLLSGWISRPLGELSRIVGDGYQEGMARRIAAVRCWYLEAQRLRGVLLAMSGQVHTRMGELHSAAHTDPLTGLGNRRGLEAALKALEALQRPFAMVELDIDFFKRVNDRYGHDVGDRVIVGLADLMRSQARQGDALFRLGGEEFLVVLPESDLAGAMGIAERLRAAMEDARMLGDEVVTLSAGVAVWAGGDVEQTLKAADQALYRAKQGGRNRVEAAP